MTMHITRCGTKGTAYTDLGSKGCGYFSNVLVSDIGHVVGDNMGRYRVIMADRNVREFSRSDGVCMNPYCMKTWHYLYFVDLFGEKEVLTRKEYRDAEPLTRFRTRTKAAEQVFG